MTVPRRHLALLAGFALALLVGSDAWAGAPTEQLRTQIERVVKVLEDPQLKVESRLAERRAAVRKIVDVAFDFAEMAKRALAQHWAARTPAEREEFVQLFADLLEQSYLSQINQYNGEPIHFTSETVDGELAVVRTKIVTKQGSEIPVDYQMLRKGDRWLVYDVRIEGVSLVANYRTQFNRIVHTSSYRELVKKLQAKRSEANASLTRQSK